MCFFCCRCCAISLCMIKFERLLLNHPSIAYFFAFTFYLPLIILLFLLYLVLAIPTLITNIFIFILCCGNLYNITSCNKNSTWSNYSQQDNISKQTHSQNEETPLKVGTKSSQKTGNGIAMDDDDEKIADSESISVLQFNAFNIFGRFWQRHELYTKYILNKYKPDIICIEEAVTGSTIPTGTRNTLLNLDSNNNNNSGKYDAFDVAMSPDLARRAFPILFNNSWFDLLCLDKLQNWLNVLFWVATFRDIGWDWILNSNTLCQFLFLFFTNILSLFGETMAFKNCKCYHKDFIVLRQGMV